MRSAFYGFIFGLGLVAAAGYAFAQDATLSVPVSRNAEAKYVIVLVFLDFAANTGYVDTSVRDAGNVEIRRARFVIPGCGTSTWTGLLAGMGTTRATETGVPERRGNFRVTGYLSDSACITGVTVNP